MHTLPKHPTTGLTAIGLTKRGRPVWPVLGGDGNGGGEGSGGGGQGGGDPAGQGDNGGQGGGGERTFTQEQLDAIVGDRLARERQKFADYEDLKAKAAKFDEHQKAQQTDLEKLQNSYEEVLGKAEKAEHALRIERAARKHGVPDDAVEFLTGETDDEVDAKAKKLAELAAAKQEGGDGGSGGNQNGQGGSGPSDPSQGAGSAGQGGGSLDAGRELYKQRTQKT